MFEFQGLSTFSRLTIKILFVLWLLAVVVESGDLTKRDIVHRIVLKSGRKPRSQKHHYHHSHGKSHREVRGQRHAHRDYDRSREFDDSRYVSKEEIRESRRNRSPEDSRENGERTRLTSLESRENSFEGSYEFNRYHKEPHTRSKHPKVYRSNVDFDVEESRVSESSKVRHNLDDWASTIDDVPPPPPKSKTKKKSKKYQTPLIEFTTSFPVKPPPAQQYSGYDPSYPPFPALPPLPSAFQYNHKKDFTEPPNLSQQFPVLQPKPVNQFTNFLPIQSSLTSNKNSSNGYEVHENGSLDASPTNVIPTSASLSSGYRKTSSTGFGFSTPPNIVKIIKSDIEKISTARPPKRRPHTKG